MSIKVSRTSKTSLRRKLINIDQFSHGVGFRENGNSSFGTLFGGLISVGLFVTLIIYAVKKGTDFYQRNESKFSDHFIKDALTN